MNKQISVFFQYYCQDIYRKYRIGHRGLTMINIGFGFSFVFCLETFTLAWTQLFPQKNVLYKYIYTYYVYIYQCILYHGLQNLFCRLYSKLFLFLQDSEFSIKKRITIFFTIIIIFNYFQLNCIKRYIYNIILQFISNIIDKYTFLIHFEKRYTYVYI